MSPSTNQGNQPSACSQREIATAVDIAHLAGWFGYLAAEENSTKSQFVLWAVEFEKMGCKDDIRQELMEAFAKGKMVDEVNRGRASFGNANPAGVESLRSRARKGMSMSGMPLPGTDLLRQVFPPYDRSVCDYRGVEIQACLDDGDDICEENENPEFFGVYLRRMDADDPGEYRAESIADFSTHEGAKNYAISLQEFIQSNQPQYRDPVYLLDKYEQARNLKVSSRP